MKKSDALMGARGQIVWILALVLSTATIIHLERQDIGDPERRLAQASGAMRSSAAEALIAAEARYKAFPEDPQAAVGLVLALSVAVQTGALDISAGRARSEGPRDQAKALAENAEIWRAVEILADFTLGR